jgi:hypothetical protein
MRLDTTLIPAFLAMVLSGVCAAACPLSASQPEVLWTGNVSDWSRTSRGASYQFGADNISQDAAGMRVDYPKGSYDPSAVRTSGAPLGGAQFRTRFDRMDIAAANEIGVRYRVALQDNFQFVRGGKLPGLYAGTANTGGRVPNGTDGYSLRFVWQAQGLGALSVYLPTSGKWGSVFGLGNWRFYPGRDIDLALYIKLNTPGQSDGVIAAWANDALVAYAPDIVFRTVDTLGIDGFYFSTFFGGGTADWATPVKTASIFSGMEIFRTDLQALARCAAAHADLRNRREMN